MASKAVEKARKKLKEVLYPFWELQRVKDKQVTAILETLEQEVQAQTRKEIANDNP